MITNEKLAELVEQTGEILRVAFKRGHLPFNETAILASPVAAVVLQRLIDDYDFDLTTGLNKPTQVAPSVREALEKIIGE